MYHFGYKPSSNIAFWQKAGSTDGKFRVVDE
jgi:hypothetical protein